MSGVKPAGTRVKYTPANRVALYIAFACEQTDSAVGITKVLETSTLEVADLMMEDQLISHYAKDAELR